MERIELFVVKHYQSDINPTIKGNGFDGLRVGEDREEAEEFVRFINQYITVVNQLIDSATLTSKIPESWKRPLEAKWKSIKDK